MILSLKEIQDHLKTNKIDSQIQKESDQLLAGLKIEEKEFPIFVRIYERGDLYQVLAFFPSKIRSSKLTSVARLLHFFNRELDMPGFGMDEPSRVVFFRSMIPSPNKMFDPILFNAHFHATVMACQTFAKTIDDIATGKVEYDELMSKVYPKGDKEKTLKEKKKESL